MPSKKERGGEDEFLTALGQTILFLNKGEYFNLREFLKAHPDLALLMLDWVQLKEVTGEKVLEDISTQLKKEGMDARELGLALYLGQTFGYRIIVAEPKAIIPAEDEKALEEFSEDKIVIRSEPLLKFIESLGGIPKTRQYLQKIYDTEAGKNQAKLGEILSENFSKIFKEPVLQATISAWMRKLKLEIRPPRNKRAPSKPKPGRGKGKKAKEIEITPKLRELLDKCKVPTAEALVIKLHNSPVKPGFRAIAEFTGLSHYQVKKILKDAELKPHKRGGRMRPMKEIIDDLNLWIETGQISGHEEEEKEKDKGSSSGQAALEKIKNIFLREKVRKMMVARNCQTPEQLLNKIEDGKDIKHAAAELDLRVLDYNNLKIVLGLKSVDFTTQQI